MGLSPVGNATTQSQGSGNAIGQNPIVDPQSTNLILYSQALDNAAWLGAAVVTPDTTLAPDGTLTADTVSDNSAVATLNKNQAVAVANDALPVVASCYILAGSSTQATLSLALTGGATPVTASITFNPVNGQIVAAPAFAYAIAAIKIGAVTWLRVQVTAANNASGNTVATLTLIPADNGVAAQGTVIAWGQQIEKQLAATGYIPTAGQTVTRAPGRLPSWTLDTSETILAKVGAYVVDAIGDKGKCITGAGTFTVSLPAAATAGNGFWIDVENIGTGAVTVAANGAENIFMPGYAHAGQNTVALPYAGSAQGAYNARGGRFVCDGAQWQVVNIATAHGSQVFTSNGTFVVPEGITALFVTGRGGGGGGGGSTSVTGGTYGGRGVSANEQLVAVTPGASLAVTLGTGGGGGNGSGSNGSAGNNTTLGALLTLAGGSGGTGAAVSPWTASAFDVWTGAAAEFSDYGAGGTPSLSGGGGGAGSTGFLSIKW